MYFTPLWVPVFLTVSIAGAFFLFSLWVSPSPVFIPVFFFCVFSLPVPASLGLYPTSPVSLLCISAISLTWGPSCVPPPHPVSPWPTGLLKEKERKATLPSAPVPGPVLETAGPADAPTGAVSGGGSPRGRSGPVAGPSLFAPLLWERTLPFGDVEYVDLDAFLLEHGLPPSPPPPGGLSPAPSPARTPAPSPGPGSCSSSSPRSSPGHAPARATLGAAGGHRAGAAKGRGWRAGRGLATLLEVCPMRCCDPLGDLGPQMREDYSVRGYIFL